MHRERFEHWNSEEVCALYTARSQYKRRDIDEGMQPVQRAKCRLLELTDIGNAQFLSRM
jgi:hypothetical protein